MAKNIIRYNNIIKRSQCLNSLSSSTTTSLANTQKTYNNIMSLIENAKDLDSNYRFKQMIRSYIESLVSIDTANEFYYQPIELCEKLNNINCAISDNIIYEYTNRILPYIKDLNLVESYINRSNRLTDNQINNIASAVVLNEVADRIVKNHNMISKRYNIEKEINRYNALGLKYLVDSCADKLSTYSIKNYQKMNIVIEEVYYLLTKNNIKYENTELGKYALEYYLTQSPYTSDIDIDNYKRVISESYVLSESDVDGIRYMSDVEGPENSISTEIDNYIMSKNKAADELPDKIKDILVNTSLEDIKYNSGKIISLLWDLAKNKVFDDEDKIYESFNIIIDLPSNISNINKDICKEDISDLLEVFENYKSNIYNIGLTDIGLSKSANEFIKNALEPCIESLKYLENIIYTKDNLDILEFVNNKDAEVIPLNEFKIFKFHNLVRAAFNLEKFLKIKEKKFYDKANKKVSKFINKTKNILFGESVDASNLNIFDFIGEDCKADICVKQYLYENNELANVSSYLKKVCGEYNDILVSQDESCRVYYIINPGVAEIRIKESASIELSESDMEEVYNNLDPAIDTYLELMAESNTACDIYDSININSIESNIANLNKCDNFTMEHFTTALEAMEILGIDRDTVIRFGEKFSNYQFNLSLENGSINESYNDLAKNEKVISDYVSSYNPIDEEVSWEDKVKACSYLEKIFEYSYPKADDDYDEDDEDEEDDEVDNTEEKKKKDKETMAELKKKSEEDVKLPPAPEGGYKGSININNIKLGLMGLKTKFKDMSTKEKELSRNLDNATRALVKGIKDSLVSDRREAIIKGSVIPSFSRCMKAALGLCIVGYFSLPAACIAAVAGLAMSKKLTDKERLLLLDEIETELDVVEKELAIAESNNQINKYRALLQYKKNLQRQYQRIRYNIRVGKDLLPDSAAGVPHNS